MKPVQIIIVGATDIGHLITSKLYTHNDITLIDEKENLPDHFKGMDITYLPGNGSDLELLSKLNLKKGAVFICCSEIDEVNIVSCWTAKKLAKVITVCFVSKPELYKNLASPVHHRYQTQYDIDTVIWPEHLLTQAIFRIITVPEAVDVEYFSKGRVKLLEYRIKEESILAGTRIMDYDYPEHVLVAGITREEKLFIPKGNSRIEVNDKVMFMGYGAELDLLAANLFHLKDRIRNAVIIGGGNVGYFLARQLEEIKVKVTIIEEDKDRCLMLSSNLAKALILHGDGTDIRLLEEEAVSSSDIVICVTNNDEKNLLCSLLLKQLGAERIVTRVGHTQNIPLFEKAGVDVVVSAMESAIQQLYNILYTKDISLLATVGGGQGEILRITVPASFAETRVEALNLPENSLLAVIRRGTNALIPDGSTPIFAHDKLKFFTLKKEAETLRAIFSK